MEKAKGKIRIKDIARMAGVSAGTVDRVLHQRGIVSEKSRKAVNKVLEEINYSPNLLARSLASKKSYRFICLFTDYQKGEYWESIEKGFRQAAEEFENYKVEVLIEHFNQFDSSSFVEAAKTVMKYEPNAVIMSPVFRQETLEFTHQLSEKNIPFSFIDSMIEDADFIAYYGQHSSLSGYIGGKLLFQSLPPNSRILILHTFRKGSSGAIQTENRKKGVSRSLEATR
jgi:LacI family transcriptional regulator